jgi:Uncharacterized conserved protein
MNREELLQRISIDPNICFGKPCIRGHRIWVSLILDMLSSGMSTQKYSPSIPSWRKQIFSPVSPMLLK